MGPGPRAACHRAALRADPLARPGRQNQVMISTTTFAGKTVAVFGLGSSGLLAARALPQGGADVIVFDDDEKKIAEAQAAGLKTQNLRELDWSKVAALVLTPGVPLTHPAPHWAAALARKANVEVIGDIELFCRER